MGFKIFFWVDEKGQGNLGEKEKLRGGKLVNLGDEQFVRIFYY